MLMLMLARSLAAGRPESRRTTQHKFGTRSMADVGSEQGRASLLRTHALLAEQEAARQADVVRLRGMLRDYEELAATLGG